MMATINSLCPCDLFEKDIMKSDKEPDENIILLS